jgi:hypothetical protein
MRRRPAAVPWPLPTRARRRRPMSGGRDLSGRPSSPVECDQALGLADGSSIPVTIRGVGGGEDDNGGCRALQADLGPTGDVTWTFKSNVGLAADFGGRYRVESPGCTGDPSSLSGSSAMIRPFGPVRPPGRGVGFMGRSSRPGCWSASGRSLLGTNSHLLMSVWE